MNRRTAIAIALLSCSLASAAPPKGAYNRPQVPIVPTELIPPSPALSPEEELKTFQLAPGIRVELVASEPMIAHPVAAVFDPDGRLWVAEMRGYMPNLEGAGEDQPVGRVSVLSDADGDGRMDKAEVFMDGLVMPRAVMPVRDGALIGAPPYLWFCRDTNGDGKADEKVEVAKDFGYGIDPKYPSLSEPENKPNNPLWAFDNWIYSGHYVGKFRWRNGAWERGATTSRGQWGLSQDDWGRLFNNSNSDQLRADIIPTHYLGRNPHYPRARGRSAGVAKDQFVWPARVSPGINRGYVPEMLRDYKLKEFTSACAPWIYRADLFPPDFYGNAFVCEPAGNLIKRNILTAANGTLSAREAYDRREFIASTDERFRPVNLTTGPDGALYVCDMYHGIIQHRISVSKYLEDQVKARGLEKPTGTGRIWRVVPDSKKAAVAPRMSKETPEQWVQHLSHANAWWRETAQRLLVERGDAAVAPQLEAVVTGGTNAMGRVQALWTLEGIGKLALATAEQAFKDADPRVSAAAVRATEPLLLGNQRGELIGQWIELAGHESAPEVQLQLALSLGEARDPSADLAMAKLLQRAPDNSYLRDAVLSGVGGRELELIEAVLPQAHDATLDSLLSSLAGCVAGERKAERVEKLLRLTAELPETARNRQVALLNGLTTSPIATAKRPVKLSGEPGALARMREDTKRNLKVSLDRAAGVLTWPGKPGAVAEVAVTPLTAAQQARYDTGKYLYQGTCGACHQVHGLGLEGLAPPLADSEWVNGSVERLARIAINGVRGAIEVGGRRYSLDMPGWGALDDEAMASILTYIRREWEHTADPVDPETIKRIRAEVKDRTDAWTQPELLKVPAK